MMTKYVAVILMSLALVLMGRFALVRNRQCKLNSAENATDYGYVSDAPNACDFPAEK